MARGVLAENLSQPRQSIWVNRICQAFGLFVGGFRV